MIKEYPYRILSYLVTLSFPALFIQTTALPQSGISDRDYFMEELYVRSDRDLYISGETVYLKLFSFSRATHKSSSLSRVAYTTLVDDSGNPVLNCKILISGSSGSGTVALPDTLGSGNYFLASCTHWMKNFSSHLYSYKKITVINPFRMPDMTSESNHSVLKPSVHGALSDNLPVSSEDKKLGFIRNVGISTQKDLFSCREKVKLDFFVPDSSGQAVECDVLVSVVRRGILSGRCPTKNSVDNEKNDEIRLPHQLSFGTRLSSDEDGSDLHLYLPEPDGHIITGSIRNASTGEPLKEEIIVLSFVGKKALCRFCETDENGRFIFVSLETGTREIVIGPLSGSKDYYVELDNPFPDNFCSMNSGKFHLDTGILAVAEKTITAMQVKRSYDLLRTEKTEMVNHDSEMDFFGVPDFSVSVSDYIPLTTLREVFKELVPGVVTGSRMGKTIINTVYKQDYQIEVRDPLVIIDGVPVADHERILNIPGDRIEKVDVVNTRYIVSGIPLDGIINITTKKGDLADIGFEQSEFRQEYRGISPLDYFSHPDYSDITAKESRIPDFRNTLYWNPHIITDKKGAGSVEFFTSDEPGEFLIFIEGFTPDGLYCAGSKVISVKSGQR